MKVVINRCYGGFSVSKAVMQALGLDPTYGYLSNKDFGINSKNEYAYRSHPALIEAIEKLGIEASSGFCAELKIVEIPDYADFEITNHDGMEEVRQRINIWY